MKYLNQTVLAAALAVAGISSAEPFKVIVPMSADDEGAMARLVNYDNGTTVDSVLVADGMAVFEGQIDEPVLGRVTYDAAACPYSYLKAAQSRLARMERFSAPCSTTSLGLWGRKCSSSEPSTRAPLTIKSARPCTKLMAPLSTAL